jgi:hypothetical protein
MIALIIISSYVASIFISRFIFKIMLHNPGESIVVWFVPCINLIIPALMAILFYITELFELISNKTDVFKKFWNWFVFKNK